MKPAELAWCLALVLGCGGDGGSAVPDAPPLPDAPSPDADPCTTATGDVDLDGDGASPDTGDCDECRADVGPRAFEVLGASPAVDDDCDGQVDEAAPPCDSGLAVASTLAADAARALDVCTDASGAAAWGLVSAAWEMPGGAPLPSAPAELAQYHLGHGLPPDFGPRIGARGGDALLMLSSGTARRPNDVGHAPFSGYDKQLSSPYPVGFPRASSVCDSLSGPMRDPVSLTVTLLAPSNAHSVSLDWSAFFYDFPTSFCSVYNDTFAVQMTPAPPGTAEGLVVTNASGDVPSLNTTFVDICSCDGAPPGACDFGGIEFECPAGDAGLLGTGYDEPTPFGARGATTWHRSRIPVEPGSEFTLRFSLWDAGDAVGDTTALVDNLAWSTEEIVAPNTASLFAPPATCGDGDVDAGEACDPQAAAPVDCSALLPLATGTLRCSSGCQFIGRDCVLP